MDLKTGNNALIAVIRREIERMISRPFYYAITLLLPLFSLFFMSTIFNNGQMDNLPIGVVDMNNTSMSRELIRDVDAVPTLKVTEKYNDQASARRATQKKDIYGYIVIPENYDDRVNDDKKVSVCFYYHYALLSVGGEVLSAFQTVLEPYVVGQVVEEAMELGLYEKQAESFVMPTDQKFFLLYNPDLNYAIYLSYPFFVVFFQILILITSLYIAGIEVKQRTAKQWLDSAKGNIYIAIAGKFLPYTIIYWIVAIFSSYVMFYLFNIPHSSGIFQIIIAFLFLILATQALGIFVYSIFPVMGITISIASMLGSLGATLSGLTFPVPQMYTAVRILSWMLPVRHFVLIYMNLVYGDPGFKYMWSNYVYLWIFMFLPLLTAQRLKKSIMDYKLEKYE